MKVDIGIITTREDENEALLQRFSFTPYNGSRGRIYGISQVQTEVGGTCVVAIVRCSEQGTDVAQQVARDMIEDLDPQLLLVVGIAGGIPSGDFTLGDVIISTRIHNFNINARKGNEVSYDARGGIHPFVSNVAASLPLYKQRQLADWSKDAINFKPPSLDPTDISFDGDPPASWQKDVTTSIIQHFGNKQVRNPLFTTGSIASSNSLIRQPAILIPWLQTARTIRAVEMEAAGVYQAAQQMDHQYPVMAIRGISDIIGLERDPAWTPYACQTAAAFTCTFIKAGIIKPRRPSLSSEVTEAKSNLSTASSQEKEKLLPLNVFISYSPEDERFKKELETHLSMLKRDNIIRPWHSQQLSAGQEWEKEISKLIDQAQIILFLVSPSFLASDYLYEQEMQHAMRRHEDGDAYIVPIVIRPVDLGRTPFKKLLALPRNGSTVNTWNNRDEIWASIAKELRDVCVALSTNQH